MNELKYTQKLLEYSLNVLKTCLAILDFSGAQGHIVDGTYVIMERMQKDIKFLEKEIDGLKRTE
jgi:hypothetical protein